MSPATAEALRRVLPDIALAEHTCLGELEPSEYRLADVLSPEQVDTVRYTAPGVYAVLRRTGEVPA